MANHITTVFLDLYQTVAYFHPPREQRLRKVLEEFGLKAEENALHRGFLAADHYYTLCGIRTASHLRTKEQNARLFARYQQIVMREAGLKAALKLTREVYKRYWGMERNLDLFPDVGPALEQLRASGYRMGLITNVDRDPTEDLERIGLKDRFDAVTASCIVGCEKPDARVFLAATDALGVSPVEAVHVGDQYLADVQGATKAGLKAVLLDRWGVQDGRHPARIRSLLELEPLLRNGNLP